MLDDVWGAAQRALGTGGEGLDPGQMALRAALVFLAALLLVRLGAKRFLARATAFDLVLAFILGSVLSRAVTGNAPFVPTLAAGAVLVGLHWVFSEIAFRSHRLGVLFKGRPRELVRDGEIRWEQMRGGHITRHDLNEAFRLHGHPPALEGVRSAHLERSGEISVVESQEPRVVEVRVEPGVQTVRVEIA